ncbi:MAG: Holliday junction branch migration protein RuvA [Candidatus Hydrogenedentes bacterium]|nr:Holliday junction branch migration protein RuvA [Candidatus Hydrogenedentota bacterium]
MFSYLKGVVTKLDNSSMVLDVNGVGFLVSVPTGVMTKFRMYQEILIPVVVLLRESSIDIYGFESEEQKILFNKLLQVNGIGPKVAMSILSAMSISDFLSAVEKNDYKAIAKSPGVGKKLGQRIVLEFKNKMGEDAELSVLLSPHKEVAQDEDEVYLAMVAMGCNSTEARQASNFAKKALGEGAPVEDLIKKALVYIKGGRF